MSRLYAGMAAGAAVVALMGCGGGQEDAISRLKAAVAADASRATAHDPCSLLSAGEAQPYVGAVSSSPFRASDGAPDTQGDQCVYKGKDGREITVRPTWEGGQVIGQVLQGVPNAVGAVLSKGSGDTGFNTMAHAVMKPEPGPWDKATWIPSGSLFATKGQTQVSIDVSGASGRESDALAIAKIVMPRFDHPLAYDGAKAVALAPKPKAHPADACQLLPSSAVEAAIGPLQGTPASEPGGTTCTYRTATAQGTRTYPVEFVWQGGAKNYAMLTYGMSMLGGMTGLPSGSPLDTINLPPQAKQMMGGPGAVTDVGFKTDTTLKGPWDRAALLHGTQLIAVRHDVMVGMTLESADYPKAKALIGAICERL
jgi:hypothetical protein